MSDQKIALTRRRALTALGVIGVGGAAAGAGTFAAFSDTETSDGSLTAGTLDLTQSNTPLQFTANNITPGDSGSDYVTLGKSGNVAGDLSISVTSVTSNEEGSSDGNGNLADQVELTLWINEDQNDSADNNDVGLNSDGTITSSASKGDPAFATAFGSNTTWNKSDTNSPGFFEDFGGGVDFVVEWEFIDDSGESFTNNDAQGDDLTVDFEFTLEQQ